MEKNASRLSIFVEKPAMPEKRFCLRFAAAEIDKDLHLLA